MAAMCTATTQPHINPGRPNWACTAYTGQLHMQATDKCIIEFWAAFGHLYKTYYSVSMVGFLREICFTIQQRDSWGQGRAIVEQHYHTWMDGMQQPLRYYCHAMELFQQLNAVFPWLYKNQYRCGDSRNYLQYLGTKRGRYVLKCTVAT